MDKLVFYSIQTKNLCDHIMQKTGMVRDWELVKTCGEHKVIIEKSRGGRFLWNSEIWAGFRPVCITEKKNLGRL